MVYVNLERCEYNVSSFYECHYVEGYFNHNTYRLETLLSATLSLGSIFPYGDNRKYLKCKYSYLHSKGILVILELRTMCLLVLGIADKTLFIFKSRK
jgi:hypothetical protein